jgi:hypothetical protein
MLEVSVPLDLAPEELSVGIGLPSRHLLDEASICSFGTILHDLIKVLQYLP